MAVAIGGWRGALFSVALGVVLVYLSARSVLAPIAKLARAAQAMARGAYHEAIRPRAYEETSISTLGEALNSISRDLATKLQAISEDRRRLEAVLAGTLEGVIVIDSGRKVTLMNQAAEKLLDLNSASCVGRLFDACFRHPQILSLVEQALASRELGKHELVAGSKTLEVYATPLGEGVGVVLVLHDLTEIRRLETLRRDFVANVSHELKTPLTSIRACVDTLLDGGLEDQQNNLRFLQKIEVHASRLAALITDLLSLSKIESGDAFTAREHVNLGELVLGCFQRLAPMAEAKRLAYRMHLPEEPVFVLGDPEAVHQIFDNLIDNAIKYTEPGGTIDVAVSREGETACAAVRDTGIGIPKEDQPRIFERFYRVDKARSRELGGTGLGLSIAKHLTQALGGEILVESEVGVGSTFTVRIPAV
ncbi:MAG: ATP-binding protein [Planctomycetota bacterium]